MIGLTVRSTAHLNTVNLRVCVPSWEGWLAFVPGSTLVVFEILECSSFCYLGSTVDYIRNNTKTKSLGVIILSLEAPIWLDPGLLFLLETSVRFKGEGLVWSLLLRPISWMP